jgi:xanthine dehydrogenase accessory factor
VPLVIFGASADAIPLVRMARHLGWHTTVVATHARSKSLERFADADAVILCRPEEVSARVTLTESTAVVLMTHNYSHDVELLNVLVNKPTRYLGCLGPRRRIERLLSELSCAPAALNTSPFGRLHAPIGMDLGAETASEIALSIAAEILAVLRGHSGGPLRRRRGSIHSNAPAHAAEKRELMPTSLRRLASGA